MEFPFCANYFPANELESKRGSQVVKNSQAVATSQSRGEAKPTQHQSLVGPRSMTKYTDNGEKPFDSIPFDLVSFGRMLLRTHFIRMNSIVTSLEY